MRTINAFYYNITSSQTSHTAVYGLEGERVEGLLYVCVPTCILGLMYTCVCICVSPSIFSCHHRLMHFFQLFRHGDRSPCRFFQNDEHKDYWPQGPGQLTPVVYISRY